MWLGGHGRIAAGSASGNQLLLTLLWHEVASCVAVYCHSLTHWLLVLCVAVGTVLLWWKVAEDFERNRLSFNETSNETFSRTGIETFNQTIHQTNETYNETFAISTALQWWKASEDFDKHRQLFNEAFSETFSGTTSETLNQTIHQMNPTHNETFGKNFSHILRSDFLGEASAASLFTVRCYLCQILAACLRLTLSRLVDSCLFIWTVLAGWWQRVVPSQEHCHFSVLLYLFSGVQEGRLAWK